MENVTQCKIEWIISCVKQGQVLARCARWAEPDIDRKPARETGSPLSLPVARSKMAKPSWSHRIDRRGGGVSVNLIYGQGLACGLKLGGRVQADII